MRKIQMVDLVQQYQDIKPEIQESFSRILDSAAFINGILDRIRLALENGEIDVPERPPAAGALACGAADALSTNNASGGPFDH